MRKNEIFAATNFDKFFLRATLPASRSFMRRLVGRAAYQRAASVPSVLMDLRSLRLKRLKIPSSGIPKEPEVMPL